MRLHPVAGSLHDQMPDQAVSKHRLPVYGEADQLEWRTERVETLCGNSPVRQASGPKDGGHGMAGERDAKGHAIAAQTRGQ